MTEAYHRYQYTAKITVHFSGAIGNNNATFVFIAIRSPTYDKMCL